MVNIKRINELAKKQREVGLTEEEKKEQAVLRKEYIDSIVGNLKAELDNTYIIDENGKHKVAPKNKTLEKTSSNSNDKSNEDNLLN